MKNILTILAVAVTFALSACAGGSCPLAKKSSCCSSGGECPTKAPAKKK